MNERHSVTLSPIREEISLEEYRSGWWSVRGAVGLMPTVANGLKLDKHVRHDRGQNLELEFRRPLIAACNKDRGPAFVKSLRMHVDF